MYFFYTLYVSTKFRENTLNGFKVTERARFPHKNHYKEHNFIKTVSGVTILFLCTLSDDPSYLCQIS